MAQTAYERIQTMTKEELTTLLRNFYLMGVLDDRRNGALGSIDPYCNLPSGSCDDVDYPLMLHEKVELYTIVYTTPFGTSTFGVFESWDEAFKNISKYACYTLTRTDFNTFRDGRDIYEIIKL